MCKIPKKVEDTIVGMIHNGHSLEKIILSNPKYILFQNDIEWIFVKMRLNEMRNKVKQPHNEYHICNTDISEKLYTEYCNKYGKNSIYLYSDYKNKGFDNYILKGAPSIVFMENFLGSINCKDLLIMLDNYINPIDCGYKDIYTLWDTCIIASPLPPEISSFDSDMTAALLRRLDTITYHYKEDGTDKSFSIPAKDYTCLGYLKRLAKLL